MFDDASFCSALSSPVSAFQLSPIKHSEILCFVHAKLRQKLCLMTQSVLSLFEQLGQILILTAEVSLTIPLCILAAYC